MINDVFVVDASAHSYNLSAENHGAVDIPKLLSTLFMARIWDFPHLDIASHTSITHVIGRSRRQQTCCSSRAITTTHAIM